MVSAAPCDSYTVHRRTTDAFMRHRKQTLMSKLSDSGFEEDLDSSPARIDVSPLRSDEAPAAQASTWYLQYGDIGFQIQRENEELFNSCNSLERQPQLTAEARCKLVSWLIAVHKHFRLSFECCCLAVNIVDRFMASTPVAADCFQLLGVTALLLASKQVEVCSPRISHLLSLCCDAFTKEQLCNLECLILVRLNFRLAAPTLAFFLDYYTNCIEAALHETGNTEGDNPDTRESRQCSQLARKVCELSLADYAFNKYPPSLTARCALGVSSELLRGEHRPVQQDQLWDSLVEESESPELSQVNSLALRGHFLSLGGQGSHSHNVAQECRDNLSLLVSLNQETLGVLSTM